MLSETGWLRVDEFFHVRTPALQAIVQILLVLLHLAVDLLEVLQVPALFLLLSLDRNLITMSILRCIKSLLLHPMRLLFDFLPIVAFFIAYKFFGIYVATAAAIIISLLQVISYWIKHRTVPSIQLISLVLILLFGGGTLLLHNELLIKWKPTALYWLLACGALVTQYFGKKPLMQHLLETNIVLPAHLWSSLNRNWIIFFTLMGSINLWVAYTFDTNTWVNFKLFGLLGITFVFILVQAIYLARYIRSDEKT